jgi:hypothetical protein
MYPQYKSKGEELKMQEYDYFSQMRLNVILQCDCGGYYKQEPLDSPKHNYTGLNFTCPDCKHNLNLRIGVVNTDGSFCNLLLRERPIPKEKEEERE